MRKGKEQDGKTSTAFQAAGGSSARPCVYLGRQLVEEVEGQAGNVRLGVDEQHCHLADLAFHLEHILKNQLGENRHSSLPHRWNFIAEPRGGRRAKLAYSAIIQT